MPEIILRTTYGQSSPNDLKISVKDNTFKFLQISSAETIRVSAYFERDEERVESNYAEIYVVDDCKFESRIVGITPGSRTRKGITLPTAMKEGEQLVIEVERARRAT